MTIGFLVSESMGGGGLKGEVDGVELEDVAVC